MGPNHPFDAPGWNKQDQWYFCMLHGYEFPIAGIREPFKYLIEQGRSNTWEDEYEAYKAGGGK